MGNNREVWRASYKSGSTTYAAQTIQRTQYYPSGLPWQYNTGDNPGTQPLKFNGCEFIEEHGYDVTDLGNRVIHNARGNFDTMDRFAERFPWQSPYVHAGNNPVNYVDVNGDSINISFLQQWDKVNGTNIVNTLLSNLNEQTGLTYSVSSTGVLTYNKDGSGNAVIGTTTDAAGNIVQAGSQTARDIMINAIDHTDMISTTGGGRTGVPPGTNTIAFNVQQMEGLINGAVNVDSKTMGWGMTLMHEIQHTQVGGGLSDSPYTPGPVVDKMNQIRTELNGQGANYGQRLTYYPEKINTYNYIPFNNSAALMIRAGAAPSIHTEKYIRIK